MLSRMAAAKRDQHYYDPAATMSKPAIVRLPTEQFYEALSRVMKSSMAATANTLQLQLQWEIIT